MSVTTEQFASANKANVETLLTLANTAFASAERLAALNLNTARAMLEDSVANAKALLAVKDVQELVALQTFPGPADRREGRRLLPQRLRDRLPDPGRAVQGRRRPGRRNEQERCLPPSTRLPRTLRPVPTSPWPPSSRPSPPPTRLRQHDQGCQASRRNRRSQRCRRDHRHRQGCRHQRRSMRDILEPENLEPR
jgi:hypothetical protein